MRIREATVSDLKELQELYRGTITIVNRKDYTPEQIEAWASTANRTESLTRKIIGQHFYVAEENNQIAGFASLESSGHLDMMYVHKDFQNMGIAKRLLQKIIETAATLSITKLKTAASITAKPFFEKHHFKTIQQQTVRIRDIELINFKMERVI